MSPAAVAQKKSAPAVAAPPPAPAPPPEPAAPPAPPKPVPTTPITLETLQGDWVNSVGAKINVTDTLVTLNGMPMKVHPVVVNDDGTVDRIGRLWQLNGWVEEGRIEFKEAPSREVMQFARSVIWTQATTERMEKWQEQMNALGYGGSSKDPLDRGIEGCCPGTSDAAARVIENDVDKDRKELKILNDLLTKWKEPEIQVVAPRNVIPDFSNRLHTGLSVEHVHYLATSFKEKGFIKRKGNTGHDIPVLVRETPASENGKKSIDNWRGILQHEKSFPPLSHFESVFHQSQIFCSLGNGHFNQALNLFGTRSQSLWNSSRYVIGSDQALREAVETGVASVVLRQEIPQSDRQVISRLLNSKREYKWNVNPDGSLNVLGVAEDMSACKQFEALSKVLDAQELNCLVRLELGVKESHRIGQ